MRLVPCHEVFAHLRQQVGSGGLREEGNNRVNHGWGIAGLVADQLVLIEAMRNSPCPCFRPCIPSCPPDEIVHILVYLHSKG